MKSIMELMVQNNNNMIFVYRIQLINMIDIIDINFNIEVLINIERELYFKLNSFNNG
jgi:DNA replication initiation complex subunit (GINS family)